MSCPEDTKVGNSPTESRTLFEGGGEKQRGQIRTSTEGKHRLKTKWREKKINRRSQETVDTLVERRNLRETTFVNFAKDER